MKKGVAVFSEQSARLLEIAINGWLERLDPRVKIGRTQFAVENTESGRVYAALINWEHRE